MKAEEITIKKTELTLTMEEAEWLRSFCKDPLRGTGEWKSNRLELFGILTDLLEGDN